MEKIKFNSDKEFEIVKLTSGIISNSKTLTVRLLPAEATLDEINTTVMDTSETEKITLLSESGESLAIYNGYTDLYSIKQELNAVIGYTEDEAQTPIAGKVVTVILSKPDETSTRLANLESLVTDTQLALCDVYEMLE